MGQVRHGSATTTHALRWGWVSQDGGAATKPKEHFKSGNPRLSALSDIARDALLAQSRRCDSESKRQCVRRFRARDGQIEPMRFIKSGAGKRSDIADVRSHDFRHIFANWWRIEAGLEAPMRKALGHPTPALSDRYGQVDGTGLAAETMRLGRIRDRRPEAKSGRTAEITGTRILE